jgi:hypothetical protein
VTSIASLCVKKWLAARSAQQSRILRRDQFLDVIRPPVSLSGAIDA